MSFTHLSDKELTNLRDQLVRELQKLRSTVKNYDNTIRNIVDDMQQYRINNQILIENPMEAPRA